MKDISKDIKHMISAVHQTMWDCLDVPLEGSDEHYKILEEDLGFEDVICAIEGETFIGSMGRLKDIRFRVILAVRDLIAETGRVI